MFNIDERLKATYSGYPENSGWPLIGITTNADGEDFCIRQRYCELIERAGGVPVLLAPTSNAAVISSQLDSIDAVLFTGGGDHNPLWMGEEPLPQLHGINPIRDSHELMLCRLAYNRQLPLLGICRGLQTITIALGGSVHQDLASANIPGLLKHSQDAPKSEPTHSVSIAEESMLANIFSGRQSLLVNSFHHQAAKNPGPLLHVTATAADGVTEAVESTEYKPILGVQWHPEQMADEGKPLFEWLCREAKLFAETKRMHNTILTFDSHCDTPMFFPQNIDFMQRDSRILYDLHKMNDGRIDAVNMVCYLPQPSFGESFSHKLQWHESISPAQYVDLVFDKIEEICERSRDIADNILLKENRHCPAIHIARTVADLYRDKREGNHSIMLGIENGLALEHDIRKIQYFHQRGVQYITLCHNGDNDICDSARGCNTHGGLSAFGRDVVKEMNRLGILVDLSHCAESTFYDVLSVSTKPVVCSHSNCRALCDHPRNLTDDQMRMLAEKGGVCQLTLYNGFLVKDGEASIADFFRHLDHAIAVMGINHVGIGTDFDGDGGVCGLRNASELINITRQLLRRRYSKNEIEKLWGGNWMRVMNA